MFPYKLKEPITYSQKQYTELTIRRPKVRDYEEYRKAGGDQVDLHHQAEFFLAKLTDLPAEVFAELDHAADYLPLYWSMVDFLDKNQWNDPA